MGEGAGGPGRDAGRLGERLSLREQVARAIRAALVAGEMHVGVVYSAPALATRFGVSATPVREALLDLAKDGLVEPVRNKGFRVRRPSRRDLDEIHRLRELLEVPTVERLARDGCDDALPGLRALAEAAAGALRSGDVPAYTDADGRFHTTLLARAGNARLVRIVADLYDQARPPALPPAEPYVRAGGQAPGGETPGGRTPGGMFPGGTPGAEPSGGEPSGGCAADDGPGHDLLLDRIEARDPEGAAERMRRHLDWSRRLAL